MTRWLLGAAVAAAIVAGLALATVAGGAPARLTDPAGDSGGTLDVASARVERLRDGTLRHVIATHAAWQPGDLVVGSGPPSSLCFLLWTRRLPGEDRPDYMLCATATSDGRKLIGTLARVPARGRMRRTASVAVDRPDDRSAALELGLRQLGSPAEYRFAAVTQSPGAVCTGVSGCEDLAPDRGTAKLFRLK